MSTTSCPLELANNPETRIAIAKDVLKYLVEASIQPSNKGQYVRFRGAPLNPEDKPGSIEVQELLRDRKDCAVCALGAMFITSCNKYNQLKFDELGTDRRSYVLGGCDIYKYLGRFFPLYQLWMIELAYEGYEADYGKRIRWNNFADLSYTSDDKEKCYDFFNLNPEPRGRLIKIMDNIIENNGTFVP